MKANSILRLIAVTTFTALAACGPQKHENHARENLERGGGRHQFREACAADIQKFCANEDRKRRCLKQNEDKLSEGCKAALGQRHGGRGRNRDNDSDSDNNNNNQQ